MDTLSTSNIDPVIVRVGWVILTIVTGGIAALVYLVLAIVTPEDRSRAEMAVDDDDLASGDVDYRDVDRRSSRRDRARYVIGGVLVALGVLFPCQQSWDFHLDTVGTGLACGHHRAWAYHTHSVDKTLAARDFTWLGSETTSVIRIS